MASDKELSDCLKSVEKRAFKRTLYAVRDEDAALDIVQDAMIRLAEKYADRPAAELPLLFQRILSNATMDWFRRQKVRNAVLQNMSDFDADGSADDFDLLESLESAEGMLGAELSLGVATAPFHVLVQGAGSAWRIGREALDLEMARSASLQTTLQRYLGVTAAQLATSAACSATWMWIGTSPKSSTSWAIAAGSAAQASNRASSADWLSVDYWLARRSTRRAGEAPQVDS